MAAVPLPVEITTTKSKKTRKSHPKVKSGCLTCKIRRKKCDEQRPNCKRCTDTGRKCDGYPTKEPKIGPRASRVHLPTPPNSNSSSPESARASLARLDSSDQERPRETLLQARPSHVGANCPFISCSISPCREDDTSEEHCLSTHTHAKDLSSHPKDAILDPRLSRNPSSTFCYTDREAFCFDFFRERTGPEFSGFFDSNFWSGFLLQACFYHPAVQQAVIALGAVHRRLDLGITPEAFNYCEFALRAYTKAVAGLKKALKEGDPNSLELSMVGSTLFCAFETFQGNYSEASKHMVSGLKILFDRKLQKLSTSSSRTWAIFNTATLLELFSRLELQGETLFDTPADLGESLSRSAKNTLPEIPLQFRTLEHARDVLFQLVHWHLPFLDHDDRDDETRYRDQQDYVASLFEWSCVYAEYFKRCKSLMSLNNSRAAMLLRVYREAAYLVLLVSPTPCMPEECVMDLHEDHELLSCHTSRERQEVVQAHFAKINSLVDSLLIRPNISGIGSQPCSFSSFSVDDGITPPLYLAATRCRSTKVRHQATSLLTRTAQRRQAMGKLGAYVIAERLSAMEEGALHACGFIPANTNTTSMDVTVFLEERKFLMRYCIPNQADGSLVWTQDWVSF